MAALKAFRCKNCGYLEDSDNAAEAPHPHACRVCGEGVSFHPKTGLKTINPDNWEVLADATPERLTELGLTPEQVERHTPRKAGTPYQPKHTSVSATDGINTADRA